MGPSSSHLFYSKQGNGCRRSSCQEAPPAAEEAPAAGRAGGEGKGRGGRRQCRASLSLRVSSARQALSAAKYAYAGTLFFLAALHNKKAVSQLT